MDNSGHFNTDVDESDTNKAKEVMDTEHSEIEDTDIREENSRTYEEAWKVNKRSLMKGMGAAGATAAVGGVSMKHPSVSPVQEAEAIAPLAAGAVGIALLGAGAAAGAYVKDKYFTPGDKYQEEKGESAATDIFRDGTYQDGLLEQRDVLKAINDARDELEQTTPLALAEGKNIAIDKRAAGATNSEANTAVLNRMQEYFAGVQEAFYRAQERQVLLVEGWADRVRDIYTGENNGEPLPFCFVNSAGASEWSNYNVNDNGNRYFRGVSDSSIIEDEEVELLDGQTITLRSGSIALEDTEGYTTNIPINYYSGDPSSNKLVGVYPSYELETYKTGDTGEKSSPAYIHFPQYSENGLEENEYITDAETVNDEIKEAYEIAKTEITQVTRDIYNNYSQQEAQDIKSEFKSPVGRLLNQTEKYLATGDPAYAEAIAYETGRATSDPKISLIVRYEEYDGNGGTKEPEEIVGQFTNWVPDEEQIEVGKTYDTDNISEEVRFLQATDGGQIQQRVLNGKFTVITPENSDDYSESETRYGKNDTIPIQKPTLSSRDISGLKGQFRDAKRARDNYDTAADSGGTGLGLTGNAAVDFGIVGTVGAMLYYLLRGSSGGT